MSHANRKAFTMIELVFVIVVLGILAAIAVPRLSATRDDAHLTKGRADVSAIRSAIISERQTRLFRGQSMFISSLDNGATGAAGETLFDTNGTGILLQYGIVSAPGVGHWMRTGANQYTMTLQSGAAVFTYDPATGLFDCAASRACSQLTD